MSTATTTVTVAAVQMVSKIDVGANLRDAAELIARAARAGARLVVLPEYFCIMGRSDRDKVAAREIDGDGPIQSFLAGEAAKHGIWLVGGTTPIDMGQADRVKNTALVYDPQGKRLARYDKIHLFAFAC